MISLERALLKSNSTQQRYRRGLSSGLTTLNIALSNDKEVGIRSGSVVWISGQSDSGRTVAGLTFLAEAVINPEFNNYGLYYHDTENKRPQIQRLFGGNLPARLFRPGGDWTAAAFWQYVAPKTGLQAPADAIEEGVRHSTNVYVLDTLDGLQGVETWKQNNDYAKEAFDAIRKKDSILIILSQQKAVGDKKVAAGGAAIPFYADYIIHTEYVNEIQRNISGRNRKIGINSLFSILRTPDKSINNAIKIPVPIFSDHGYDNPEALFSYLLHTSRIVQKAGRYSFEDMNEYNHSLESMLEYLCGSEVMVGYYLMNTIGKRR